MRQGGERIGTSASFHGNCYMISCIVIDIWGQSSGLWKEWRCHRDKWRETQMIEEGSVWLRWGRNESKGRTNVILGVHFSSTSAWWFALVTRMSAQVFKHPVRFMKESSLLMRKNFWIVGFFTALLSRNIYRCSFFTGIAQVDVLDSIKPRWSTTLHQANVIVDKSIFKNFQLVSRKNRNKCLKYIEEEAFKLLLCLRLCKLTI